MGNKKATPGYPKVAMYLCRTHHYGVGITVPHSEQVLKSSESKKF